MKKIIFRLAAIVVILVVVALVAVYFSLNSIVKRGVETVGPKLAKVEIKLDSALLSIFSGSGTLNGLVIGNPEGFKTESALKAGEISVVLQPKSLLTDKIVVEEVVVKGPEITFEGSLTGNNLKKIADNIQASAGGDVSAPKTGEKKAGKKIQVNHLVLSGGKINVNLSVDMLGSKAMSLPMPELELKDLGKNSDGITSDELARIISKIVLENVTAAVAKNIGNLGKGVTDAVKGLSDDPGKSVEKATKGLKEIFKKK